MADITFTAAPPLGGSDLTIGANRIREMGDLALVSVAVPHGGEDAMTKRLKSGFGLALPDPRISSVKGEVRAIRTAPDQLMLAFPHNTPDAAAHVADKLAGTGYVTDQTDVWVHLELSGPDTRAALERICPLDLHPDAFPENAAARTVIEHMGAMVVRTEADTFLLLSASSSARSFLHAVELSYRNVA